MKYIGTVIISSGLLLGAAGCSSSGDDLFSSLWNDGMWSDAPAAEQLSQPRLALTASHGAAPGVAMSVENWRSAAENGDPSAQHRLGYLYAMGDGVARDYVAAYAWLNMAVSKLPAGMEHDRAVENREMVARQMRPEEIIEAHRLAGLWAEPGVPKAAETADNSADITVEVEFQDLGFLDNLDILTAI